MKNTLSFLNRIRKKIDDYIFVKIHQIAVSLRYTCKFSNINLLYQPKPRDPKAGWLILPEHPSLIDGTLLATELAKRKYFAHIWIAEILKELSYFKWAQKHPDVLNIFWVKQIDEVLFDHHSQVIEESQLVNERVLQTVEALKKGESVVLFPAAHTKRSPKSEMRGKSAVTSILKLYPEANIMFVRIKGLWGSRFSRILKKDESSNISSFDDHLDLVFKKVISSLLQNGIFFMPKRKVELEFLIAPDDFPRQGSRIEINNYMEDFFNQSWGFEGEPIYRVPEYFWKSEYVDLEYEEKFIQFDLEQVSDDIRNEILQLISEMSTLSPSQLNLNMHLGRDVGLDSLDIQSIIMILRDKYGVDKIIPLHLTTIGHVMALAARIPITERTVIKKFDNDIVQEAFLPNLFNKIKSLTKLPSIQCFTRQPYEKKQSLLECPEELLHQISYSQLTEQEQEHYLLRHITIFANNLELGAFNRHDKIVKVFDRTLQPQLFSHIKTTIGNHEIPDHLLLENETFYIFIKRITLWLRK